MQKAPGLAFSCGQLQAQWTWPLSPCANKLSRGCLCNFYATRPALQLLTRFSFISATMAAAGVDELLSFCEGMTDAQARQLLQVRKHARILAPLLWTTN